MLEILFRREGYSVVSAPGCKAALDAIASAPQPFPDFTRGRWKEKRADIPASL